MTLSNVIKKRLYGFLISLIIASLISLLTYVGIYDSFIFVNIAYVFMGMFVGLIIFYTMSAIGIFRMVKLASLNSENLLYWTFLFWPVWFLPFPIFMMRSFIGVIQNMGIGILIMLILSWIFNIVSHALYVKQGEHPWRQ